MRLLNKSVIIKRVLELGYSTPVEYTLLERKDCLRAIYRIVIKGSSVIIGESRQVLRTLPGGGGDGSRCTETGKKKRFSAVFLR